MGRADSNAVLWLEDMLYIFLLTTSIHPWATTALFKTSRTVVFIHFLGWVPARLAISNRAQRPWDWAPILPSLINCVILGTLHSLNYEIAQCPTHKTILKIKFNQVWKVLVIQQTQYIFTVVISHWKKQRWNQKVMQLWYGLSYCNDFTSHTSELCNFSPESTSHSLM